MDISAEFDLMCFNTLKVVNHTGSWWISQDHVGLLVKKIEDLPTKRSWSETNCSIKDTKI